MTVDFDKYKLEDSFSRDHTDFELSYELPLDSPEPGALKLKQYQKDPVDAVLNPLVTNVTLMWAAQCGKTTIGTMLFGDVVINDPHTMMGFFPTAKLKDDWVRKKLTPYVRTNSKISEKLPAPSTKGWNTDNIDFKDGSGGIVLCNAGTKNAFAQITSRTIIADEIDKWETPGITDVYSALTERVATFARTGYKIFVCSTPIWVGYSRVNYLFERGSKKRFWTPCYKCNQSFVFEWKHVDVEKRELRCPLNECLINDFQRWLMIDKGYWIAENPKQTQHESFHLNGLQSKFVTLDYLITKFNESSSEAEFLAGAMAVPPVHTEYEKDIDPSTFKKYFKPRPFDRVEGVFVGVDVQHDRIEFSVAEWKGQEGAGYYHIIEHGVVPLPANKEEHVTVWLQKIYRYITDTYNPERACVDTGDGTNQGDILEYITMMDDPRWIPIKGVSPSFGHPPRMSVVTSTGQWRLAVDQLKMETIDIIKNDQLSINADQVPFNYEYQMTSERLIRTLTKGTVKQEWVRKRSRANEAWDCFVYLLAAQRTFFRENPYYNRADMVDTTDLIASSWD